MPKKTKPVKTKRNHKLIPKEKCINVFLWVNDNQMSLTDWEGCKPGMSALETGAGSLSSAMKIVRDGLKRGYTHFVLSYPVAMQGVTNRNPHSFFGRADYER